MQGVAVAVAKHTALAPGVDDALPGHVGVRLAAQGRHGVAHNARRAAPHQAGDGAVGGHASGWHLPDKVVNAGVEGEGGHEASVAYLIPKVKSLVWYLV